MAKGPLNRRSFLKTAAGAVGAATKAGAWTTGSVREGPEQESPADQPAAAVEAGEYPRRFRGRQLSMISFPLGGVTAGSLGLGGRGQL
jgi:non-lysosomal glucosylceramidase